MTSLSTQTIPLERVNQSPAPVIILITVCLEVVFLFLSLGDFFLPLVEHQKSVTSLGQLCFEKKWSLSRNAINWIYARAQRPHVGAGAGTALNGGRMKKKRSNWITKAPSKKTKFERSPKSRPPAIPDLSHIAEALRPLAIRCSSINFDSANARLHSEENIEAIMRSLSEFGQDQPIVVQKQGMIARKGNGRLEAANRLGLEWIAAVVVDENDVAAAARAIADNRSAELATWDQEKLAQLLQSIREAGEIDLAVTGFSQADLEQLLPLDVPDDQVPEPPENPVTRPGDLYALGDHRLLCGNTGNADDIDRLLDGAAIHLCNCDPPYNVKCEPRSNNAIKAGISSFAGLKNHQKFDLKRHPKKSQPTTKKLRPKDRPLVNDFLSDEQFNEMLLAWFGNIANVLLPGRLFFIWGGYSNIANYPHALKASGLYFSQQIIWHKLHPVLSRKCFMGDHEWCFFGWREGAAHQFFGPPNVSDVWSVKKINPQNMQHLTEKPVELAVRAIQYGSRPGENVFDPFGGSGFTLIGAQYTERRAFIMEIDPAYCDVIIKRWETFTGLKAQRLSVSKPISRPMRKTH
jgi:DNA modification methylase